MSGNSETQFGVFASIDCKGNFKVVTLEQLLRLWAVLKGASLVRWLYFIYEFDEFFW